MSTLEMDRTALILNRLFVLGLGAFFLRIAIRQYPRQDRDAIRVMHRLASGGAATIGAACGSGAPRAADRRRDALAPDRPGSGRRRQRTRRRRTTGRRTSRRGRTRALPALADVDMDLGIEPAAAVVDGEGHVRAREQARPASLTKVPFTISPSWRDLKWTMNGVALHARHDVAAARLHAAAPLMPGDTLRVGFSYTGQEKGATKNGGGAGSSWCRPAS